MHATRPSANPPRPRRLRLVRLSLFLFWGAIVIALGYGISDLRGFMGWNNYRRKCEALGVSLNLQSYIPEEIPESENSAAIPLVYSWLDRDETNCVFDHDHFNSVSSNDALMSARGGSQPHFCDLVAWRDAFDAGAQAEAHSTNRALSGQCDASSRAWAAPAVLEALKDDDIVFEELRRASRRGQARYPIAYNMDDPWSIRLPHLMRIKQCCRRLDLKACAELALNQSSNALADVKLALFLADSVKEEPIIISWLVRLVCVQMAIDPVWEGLAEHRWSATQLEELQTVFEHCDFYHGLDKSLRFERAAGVFTVDLIQRRGLPALAGNADFLAPRWSIARLIPSGWYDQEKLQYCRLLDLQSQSARDATRALSPRQIDANTAAARKMLSGTFWPMVHHRLIAQRLLPRWNRFAFQGATTIVSTDQASLACALERYRLAHGQYPDKLQSLSPDFISALPNDVITGQPYKYRHNGDGKFVLYSVGWNEKDDGGITGPKLFDEKEGDWVWSCPPN